MVYNILTIAGTDPSGGAGVQADIKTFSAMKTYAMSVITAVVAQNTCGVKSFQSLEPSFVGEQIDSVFEDIRVDAVKIGMVAHVNIAEVIVERLQRYQAKNIILDPVMVAKSGDVLLQESAIAYMRSQLLPLANLITPNLLEADVLLEEKNHWSFNLMQEKVVDLYALGAKAVLLKGGHLKNSIYKDIFYDENGAKILSAPRVPLINDHGAGCTLSACIAALSPKMSLFNASEYAKTYLTNALLTSTELDVGQGHGPLNHFYELWSLKKEPKNFLEGF